MTTDSLLNIKKLLDFAVQLEVIGEKFFGHWAVKADTDELKKFFRFLAEEESNHKKTFEELKQKVAVTKIDIPENQEGFEDDFEIFASTILYNEREMETVKDLAAAIALAKKQEVDAQLFFSDLIKYLPGEYVDIVKQIINEERNHFTKLSTLEEKLIKPDQEKQ